MEGWEVAAEAGIALLSGIAGAGGVLWSLARKLQQAEDAVGKAEEAAKANKAAIEKLEREVDQDRKEGAEQWQEISYTLGRIEGAMSGTPPRPRLPSSGR